MQYKNFIWDFDGTLFNSYPHVCACLLKVMEQEGIRERFDAEMVMRYLCVSFGAARDYVGLSTEAYQRFVELQYRMDVDEVEPKIMPFPDCERVLREIKALGGRHFLSFRIGRLL